MKRKFVTYMKNFDLNKIEPITNIGWCKPFGGLWASPVDSEFGWKDWCEAENFRDCLPEDANVFDVEMNNIYTIDTLEHLLTIPYKTLPNLYGYRDIDFEAMSREYNGVFLTASGQYYTRFSEPMNLYGWDCESIIIFRKEAIIL